MATTVKQNGIAKKKATVKKEVKDQLTKEAVGKAVSGER